MYDFGARNYDPALGRWMNIDPLAEIYHTDSPYTYVLNNPLSFIDPDGRQVIGVTKDDAAKVHEDLNTVFSGEKFDKLRDLFTRGKKNNRKTFDKIDGDALKDALSGLKGDDLALAELVTGAINSEDVHKVEFAELGDNLSVEGSEALNDFTINFYTSEGHRAPNPPETRTAQDIKTLGGSGFNVSTQEGSHSYILEGLGISNSGGRRYLDSIHEIFGHGIPSAKRTSNEINTIHAIRTENLARRVLKIEEQRDGSKHGGNIKIPNPSALPKL